MGMKITLATQFELAGIPFAQEVRFHPVRRWRFDYIVTTTKIAVEVNGGLYSSGRHSRGAGAEKDMEKLNEALILGWRVIVVSPRHVKDGRALEWVKRALGHDT